MEAALKSEPAGYGKIEFRDSEFYCDPDGALYWPEENCLIVSDLHLEKGQAFAAKGRLIPPYDTGETLKKLAQSIERWNPGKVISLGDSFHRHDSADKLPPIYLERLSQLMKLRSWYWITGNHDPEPPAGLGGTSLDEMEIGTISFRHEQSHFPYRSDLFSCPNGEISGHLHPCAMIHRRGKRMRRRCFVADENRLILPAFGAFTGGLDINHEAFDGLFDKGNLMVWMLGKGRVYQLPGGQLLRR